MKTTDFDSKLFAKNQKSLGLIIHDKRDVEAPFNYAKDMAEIWPKSIFVETDGLGHKLRDDFVVKAVMEFMEK
jgi:hypothetical protein